MSVRVIVSAGRYVHFRKRVAYRHIPNAAMEPYRNEGTDLLSLLNATMEDKRIHQNFQMQTFLRVNHIK